MSHLRLASVTPRPADTNDATWVYYLHADEDGDAIYVGVTSQLHRRLGQHKRTKGWWHEVIFIIATRYPTRAEALAVEAMHLQSTRKPKYNIAVPVGDLWNPWWKVNTDATQWAEIEVAEVI